MPSYRLQLIEIPDAPPKRFSWVRGAMLCNLDVPEGQVLPLIAAAVDLLETAEQATRVSRELKRTTDA